MKVIELIGDIDCQHRLRADVPEGLPVGQVRLIVFLPEEENAESAWTAGIANEWSAESLGHSLQISWWTRCSVNFRVAISKSSRFGFTSWPPSIVPASPGAPAIWNLRTVLR
jgi:hypothetical protein